MEIQKKRNFRFYPWFQIFPKNSRFLMNKKTMRILDSDCNIPEINFPRSTSLEKTIPKLKRSIVNFVFVKCPLLIMFSYVWNVYQLKYKLKLSPSDLVFYYNILLFWLLVKKVNLLYNYPCLSIDTACKLRYTYILLHCLLPSCTTVTCFFRPALDMELWWHRSFIYHTICPCHMEQRIRGYW